MSRRYLWLMLGFLLAGCTLTDSSQNVPTHRIPAPKGFYSDLAWLSSGRLVVCYESDLKNLNFTWQLWQMRLDGTGLEELPLGQDPRCRLTWYDRPTALPDGRLGFRKTCLAFRPGPDQPFKDDDSYLMAYDITTRTMEPLVQTPINLALTQFSWNPNLSRGVMGSSSGICGSILWLTRQGIEYPSIEMIAGNRSWRLDEEFRSDPSESCRNQGRADLPAWSPDGRSIAFFASPQSMGADGFARLDVPWNLYVMDPIEQKPRTVLTNVKHPSSLAWSPNGRWLAFSGEMPWWQTGMWVFATDTSTLRGVTSKEIHALAWSPGGEQLLGVANLNPRQPLGESELLIFDVKKLLQ